MLGLKNENSSLIVTVNYLTLVKEESVSRISSASGDVNSLQF